jgi:ATP-dependent helicase/nuclease subunit B
LSQSLTKTSIVADAGFWPAVADAVLRMRQTVQKDPTADLRGIEVIVPGWAHAPYLRNALQALLAREGKARSIPPRIHTIATWAGYGADDTIERRLELFAALRANDWIRSAFGDQPAALWNLAAQVASICDELTLAALDGADAFEDQLRASLARHFARRAARAIQPQAQLILQLWRAGLSQGNATTARLAVLQARSRAAIKPVVFVSTRPLRKWAEAWLALLSDRVPVHVVQADLGKAIAQRPLFAASWPELCESGVEARPIVERALALDMVSAADGPTLIEAQSLEDEALAVVDRVVQWLRSSEHQAATGGAGRGSIALVPLDRIAARRVRALLERAQILVRDETGWKLSTTSAAGAVMRLFDLAMNGFAHRDLLDWLKSPFTLHGEAGKTKVVRAIERAIRDRMPAAGLRGLTEVLDQMALHEADRALADRWFRDLQSHANRLNAGTAPVAVLARALDAALDALGMRNGLAADPVGKEVLRELDGLRARFTASRTLGAIRLAPAEFRALIAARFEEIPFAAEAVDSPVVMVSLSAAALRDFDAAVLIGADANHLPSTPPEMFFFSRAVRADLGLPGQAEILREQLDDLASLLVRVPRVLVTWRSNEGDEPRALANWLTRLRAVAKAAGADPIRTDESGLFKVAATGTPRPAPSAAHRLPQRISASDYQVLIDCPYQFYARSLLRLRPLEEITDEPRSADFGKAVHEVLANFHRQWHGHDLGGVAAEELSASLASHASAVLDPLVERRPRYFAQRSQFIETQGAYLAWLRARVGEGWAFQAAEHEASVGFEFEVAGETRRIELHGRIDRIDAREEAIEVLDYKTTRIEKLRERMRVAGEHIQLPFYGLLLVPRPAAAAFVYMQRTSNERLDPVGRAAPDQKYAVLVEAVEARLRADLARIAGGAPLPPLGNDTVCAYCKMRGLCRRDFWDDEERGS